MAKVFRFGCATDTLGDATGQLRSNYWASRVE